MISLQAVPRRTIKWYRGLWRDAALGAWPGGDPDEPVAELERRFAGYVGRSSAVAVSSCRLALVLLLEGLGVRPGDEIILPAYTEEGVPQALLKAGFKPVFVDIRPHDHNLDPEQVAAAVSDRTRALLATHIFGAPCDIAALAALCERHGIELIEDCAHAVGLEHAGRKLGSFGRASIYSFAATKPFHAFGGGMLCTDDEGLAHAVRRAAVSSTHKSTVAVSRDVLVNFAVHLLTSRPTFALTLHPTLRLLGALRGDPIRAWRAVMRAPSTSYGQHLRMHPLQARVALGMLAINDAENEARRDNAAALLSRLDSHAEALCLRPHPDHGWYFLVLVSANRDRLAAALLRAGVDTGKQIMRNCPALLGIGGSYPVTEQAFAQSLQIPVHSGLTPDDMPFIAEAVNRAVAGAQTPPTP